MSNKNKKVRTKGKNTPVIKYNNDKWPVRDQSLANKTQNLLVPHLYKARNANAVWTVDNTGLFKKGTGNTPYWSLMLILDLASRCILGYFVSSNKDIRCDINSDQVIDVFWASFLEFGTPTCLHFDGGACFTSIQVKDLLSQLNIVTSIDDQQVTKFGNQPIERLNRTFKNMLQEVYLDFIFEERNIVLSNTDNWYKPLNQESRAVIHLLISQTVDYYNDTLHRSLVTTPNFMYRSLILNDLYDKQGVGQEPIQYQHYPRICNSYDQQSVFEISDVQSEIVLKELNNWKSYFDNQFRNVNIVQQETIATLNQQLTELKEEVSILTQDLVEKNTLLKLKADEKERRRKTRNLGDIDRRIRHAAYKNELYKLYEVYEVLNKDTKMRPFTKARTKVVVLLLYLFGLRISNTLQLKKRHIIQLLDEDCQEFKISLIKNSQNSPKTYFVPPLYKAHLNEIRSDFELLIQGKNEEDLLTLPTDKSGGFLGLTRNRINFSTS